MRKFERIRADRLAGLLGKRPAARARLGIGYVPQGREIFPQMTVQENLQIGLAARSDGVRSVPDHVYALFPVLREVAATPLSALTLCEQ